MPEWTRRSGRNASLLMGDAMVEGASDTVLRIGILGASGYTGAELVRLLSRHRNARITVLTAHTAVGKSMADVFPHLAGLELPPLIGVDQAAWDDVDVVFCALPHGTTQSIIAALPPRLRVIDLSADFRLRDPDTYAAWYGHSHEAPELQRKAVYGLTELAREAVAAADLVACPGCYPTAALLPLSPLVAEGLIDAGDILIDAKSGVTGAGRAAKQEMLFGEVAEGIHAYGVARHRHAPELEQEISTLAGRPISISFTPHLMPMNRGELLTSYVRLANGVSADDARGTLVARYAGEPFVRILPAGQAPATRHVRGSNLCLIGVFADRIAGRAIVISAIDNLVKGASGQAVQNMNVMFSLPETTGLNQAPLFP